MYEPHPAAALFPMMEDVQFNELLEDIRENGQLEPIWTYKGAIIDGLGTPNVKTRATRRKDNVHRERLRRVDTEW